MEYIYNKIRDYFWQRLTKDYLQTLFLRHKWIAGNLQYQVYSISLGQTIFNSSNLLEVSKLLTSHPGFQCVFRVVTIRSNNGTFQCLI